MVKIIISNFKFLLFFLLFLSFISFNFAYVNISSCQEINSSFVFNGDREIRLNESINGSGGYCFNFQTDNVIFNCDYNNIISSASYIINIDANNITIENCIINNSNIFTGIEIISGTNNKILNSRIVNSSIVNAGATGIEIDSNKNLVQNCIIEDMGYGMRINNNYNVINNVTIRHLSGPNSKGISLSESSYNNFTNLFINSSYHAIEMTSSTGSTHNLIENNTILGQIDMEDVNTQYNIIKNNIFGDGGQIKFYKAQNNIIYENYFEGHNPMYSWEDFNTYPNDLSYNGIGNYYGNFNTSSCINSTNLTNACEYTICSNENVTLDAGDNVYGDLPIISTTGTNCFYETNPEIVSSSTSSSHGPRNPFPFGNMFFSFLCILIFIF